MQTFSEYVAGRIIRPTEGHYIERYLMDVVDLMVLYVDEVVAPGVAKVTHPLITINVEPR